MKRYLYEKLKEWKISTTRKPLILRGARQVGKTWLLKVFGKEAYTHCIYLNFEENPALKAFFNEALTPASILENISAYFNSPIIPGETLLIFDEVQESPGALTSLKYFCEKANDIHIIAAGSLLGVKMVNTTGFPVGKVNFLDLYPLSFSEYLDAINKSNLRDYLEKLNNFNEIPEPIHLELVELLKKYMFIGGMPEAISAYIKNNDFALVRTIQKEILDAYVLDFAKHAPKEQIMKISQVWESIPSQLAKENKKFIFSVLHKSARGREYDAAIQWLADAGLIHKSYHISVPKLPLSGFSDNNAFKVFLLDVGLLAAMSNIPIKYVTEDKKLFFEFTGAFTENYVAEELVRQHYQLHYWTSAGTAEIDFIIEDQMQIYPLEVKAGISRKKKSLLVYKEKFQPAFLLRSTLMNLRQDDRICNIPLYLISRLHFLIQK